MLIGVMGNDTLNWSNYVDTPCNKLSTTIFLLRNLGNYLSSELRSCYFSVFHPHVSYAITLWGASCAVKIFSAAEENYKNSCKRNCPATLNYKTH